MPADAVVMHISTVLPLDSSAIVRNDMWFLTSAGRSGSANFTRLLYTQGNTIAGHPS
jgi:hypothetical protein